MRLRLVVSFLVALGATAAVAGTGLAQDAALERARDHFDRAQAAYAQGKFEEAANEFQSAYEARAFPQFLFNIVASYEKMKRYKDAVTYYRRYLEAEPKTSDRAQIEARIRVLEGEAKRLETVAPPDPEDPDAAPEVTPSAEVAALGEVSIRGLVVIESEPQGANIYLDDKKKGPFAKTPWSGSIEGEHTILLERQGYKPVERRISPDPNRLLVLVFSMAEEDYLGWIEIRSNVPGAAIYIDDKSVGVAARTPFSGNLTPGTHKIWVTAEGYDEHFQEIEIVPGQTHEIMATLSGAPVGYLNFRGRDVEQTTIYLDGEVLCERGPCRKAVPQGTHTVTVRRPGHKAYSRTIEVQAKTETTIRPQMAKRPGRGDAVWAYVFSAAFLGGGIYLGMQSNDLRDQLEAEIAAGMPPPDPNDPRFDHGKYYSWGANAAYGLAGISLLTAVYYTFRDKGPPSTATTDVRAVAVEPHLSPGYAGVGMEVRW
jgi:tetratricopeptide (TPR) repeat protein